MRHHLLSRLFGLRFTDLAMDSAFDAAFSLTACNFDGERPGDAVDWVCFRDESSRGADVGAGRWRVDESDDLDDIDAEEAAGKAGDGKYGESGLSEGSRCSLLAEGRGLCTALGFGLPLRL